MDHCLFVRASPLILAALSACGEGAPEPRASAPPGGVRVMAASAGDTGISPGGAQQTYGCEPDGAVPGSVYFFVDAAALSGGNGARDAPFRTVQAAYLAVQSGQKAVLCVAEGTYVERVGSTADRFAAQTEYALVGGFRAGSRFAVRDSLAHPTTIQAPDRSGATIVFGNVKSITLDGHRITGGLHGVLISGGYSAGRSVTLRNNHIFGNGVEGQLDHSGGGLRLSGGQILIEHNLIEGNRAGAGGAGLYVGAPASAERNTKRGGVLHVTSALATISRNVVRDNVARHDTPHGAGISVSMNARIDHNLIEDNRGLGPLSGPGGQGVGGGLIAQAQYATVIVDSNWIAGNIAQKAGGGIFIDEASIGTIVNNVVVGNEGVGAITVDGRASGSGAEDRGYATIASNTVVGNTSQALYLLDSTVAAYNNVFWDNGGGADVLSAAGGSLSESITLDHNLLVSGCSGTALCQMGLRNLIGVAPQLLDPAAADYSLAAGSPALDAGAATFGPALAYAGALTAAPAADYDGAPRPQGPGIDLGALERTP